MLTILLHSSKTMRTPPSDAPPVAAAQRPVLYDRARLLAGVLSGLSSEEIASMMHLSPTMATKTKTLLAAWDDAAPTLPAIDCFLGDIYSGLQAQTLSADDRAYANVHLRILSGLYGVLRSEDSVQPYRLEMGYRLPASAAQRHSLDRSLSSYWGTAIADTLSLSGVVINLSAVEYTKAVFPHIQQLSDIRIVSPKFLTVSQKTGEPTFVTVHAKIARGACARWLIQQRVTDINQLKSFNLLGYTYSSALSTDDTPVFVAREFEGLGLSVRLT